MRLVTYIKDARQSWGVWLPTGIVDIPAIWPDGPRSLLEALQGGDDVMPRVASLAASQTDVLPLEQVRLLAPIPQPPKLIGLAGNYVKHVREFDKGKGLSDRPRMDTTPRPFLMPATAVAGPNDEIAWPVYSKQIDHEIELAVVIGKTAKCVSPESAVGCIAGYTIANDISARSATFAQGRSSRPWDEFYDWLNGKWADGFLPLGPCIVTPDAIGDVRNLTLELTVNGETRQKASTAEMTFDVFEIVSFISHIMTLVPGDVIATGTPSGVAMATGKWLAGGDVMSCSIDNIGQLTNRLGAPPAEFFEPCNAR